MRDVSVEDQKELRVLFHQQQLLAGLHNGMFNVSSGHLTKCFLSSDSSVPMMHLAQPFFFNKRRRASETGGDKAGNVERVNSPVSLSLSVWQPALVSTLIKALCAEMLLLFTT